MDELRSEYEHELTLLRGSLSEFSKRYPKVAARLAISGDHSEDIHVERMIQSAALMNARTKVRLNDDVPEFTAPLLEVLYPEYLRPFPSCSIAQFGASAAVSLLTQPVIIRRGAELTTRVGEYCFCTVYDVTLAPLQITHARYEMNASAPASLRLPPSTTGMISLTVATTKTGAKFGGAMPGSIRIFLDGPSPMVAALIDTLRQHTSAAFAEFAGAAKWVALSGVPVATVGFQDDEALIERPGGQHSSFRLLLEYCAFPHKFDFIDVDLAALMRATGPCEHLTLHVPVTGVHRDSAAARAMEPLAAENLKLFCTPIINLFKRPAESITLKGADTPFYPLVPQTVNAPETAVYSVDDVRMMTQTAVGSAFTRIEPYHGMSHRPHDRSAVYWLAERDERFASFMDGQDTLLSLLDIDGQLAQPLAEQLDVNLTCTNSNIPASLSIGHPEGDLLYADSALIGVISLLRPPTESVPLPVGYRQQWQLHSMMTANPIALNQSGLPALKALLTQHVPSGSPTAARHIEGIVGLSRESVMEWLVMKPTTALVRGIRVRLVLDELMFSGHAVSIFADVVERVFVRYASMNSFVQLMLISRQNGSVLAKGLVQQGATQLI